MSKIFLTFDQMIKSLRETIQTFPDSEEERILFILWMMRH